VTALSAAALAACGFPDVTFAEGSTLDGSAGETDQATPTAEAASPVDAADEVMVDGPGVPDAPADHVAVDTGTFPDATPDGPLDCDVDGDGYLAMGPPCNGQDCCDDDRNANPGQTQFFTAADACGSFDYNCDGSLEAEYAINIACKGTGLTGCKGGPAFVGDPACGTQGSFANSCTGSGALACQPGTTTMQAQGCK
jgi:hypothetical protein